ADLGRAVFDSSLPLSREDLSLLDRLEVLKRTEKKEMITIVNKCDLEPLLEYSELEKRLGTAVYISAKDGAAAEALSKEINSRFGLSELDANAGYLANERQRSCIARAARAVNEALAGVMAGVTPDAVGVLLEQALDAVYELSGRKASDEVINEVFKRFCVGK
ncbi:MAG: tRNA uridine-5-carboxymethylaminomethyl(34) synthesis GTPase MnmE, partial [Oscillospiraceae bacterium]|nr:tRNA uridine-5-carboxymethylaminomethyl(34) synthesis GTPase MnmE [Oscillospiraceae bacterium]